MIVERHTGYDNDGQAYIKHRYIDEDGLPTAEHIYGDEAAIFAAYEGSGLTSGRLAELAMAEHEDRLVVLPFAIGSTIYCICDEGSLRDYISEQTVHGYAEHEWRGANNVGKDPRFIVTIHSSEKCNDHACIWQLRHVFKTHEEAETALAKRMRSAMMTEYEKQLEQAYLEFPRKERYSHTEGDGHICTKKVIYCNGVIDIVRCEECGREWPTRCNFDDDYS